MIYLINGPDYDEVIKKVKEIAAQNSDSEVLKYNGLDNSLDYRSLGYELLKSRFFPVSFTCWKILLF